MAARAPLFLDRDRGRLLRLSSKLRQARGKAKAKPGWGISHHSLAILRPIYIIQQNS